MDILIVEDNPQDAELLRRTLARTVETGSVTLAGDIAAARNTLREKRFDLILLDLGLPDSEGLETLHRVQEANETVPIIIVSATDESELALAAVHEGADDYLIKGDHRPSAMLRSIRYVLNRKQVASNTAARPRSAPEETRPPVQDQLNVDIAAAVSQVQGSDRKAALMMVDVDHFAHVNEAFGRDVGNTFLHRLIDRFRDSLRTSDQIVRLDGDVLAVLSTEAKNAREIEAVAIRLHRAMQNPIVIDGHSVAATVSIGIAIIPDNGSTPAEVRANAAEALREAKDNGRNCTRFCSREINDQLHEYHARRQEFATAIQDRQFEPRYQPRFTAKGRLIHSVVATSYWRHPQSGLLPARAFMPMATEHGYDARIQESVLPMIAGDVCGWIGFAEQLCPVVIALAPTEMSNALLVEKLQRLVNDYELPPTALEIGFGEQAMVGHSGQAVENMRRLHELGMRISILDFGLGLGPIHQLARLPVDSINIDASLVAKLGDARSAAFVKAIIAAGHSLGIAVTASGVDEGSTAEQLVELGCDAFQGDYFVPTMDSETTLRFLLES